jgi:hypothetical protein
MDTRTADREEEFWRTQYRSRDYVTYGGKVEDYLPAYRYGIDASLQFPDRTFAEMDATLQVAPASSCRPMRRPIVGNLRGVQ